MGKNKEHLLLGGRKLPPVLMVALLSLAALFAHGYKFNTSDQKIVIPFILRIANPSLFPKDLLFSQSSATTSLFYYIAGRMMTLVDIQWMFFAGYVLFQFLLFTGIYLLAKEVLRDKYLAVLSLFPFLLPKFIAGLLTYTYDVFFMYRIVGLVFLLFFLRAVIKRQYYRAVLLAGIGTLIHPISFVPNFLILPAAILFVSSHKRRDLLITTLMYTLFIIPFLLLTSSHPVLGTRALRDPVWMQIIRDRDNYLSVRTWSFMDWVSFGFYLSLVLFFLPKLVKPVKKIALVIVGASLTVFLLSVFLVDIFGLPIFTQFQLLRSYTVVAYVALVFSPLFLTGSGAAQKITGFLCLLAITLNAYFVFLPLFGIYLLLSLGSRGAPSPAFRRVGLWLMLAVTVFWLAGMLIFKRPDNSINFPYRLTDWDKTQLWARSHTDMTATFLVPPQQTGFRVWSRRPIVGDYKDGAVVAYSPQFAREWNLRMADLRDYPTFTTEKFLALHQKYVFDYIITVSSQKLDFPLVSRNPSFLIYAVR